VIDETITLLVREAVRTELTEMGVGNVTRLTYTVTEAAEALGVSETTVRNLVRQGRLRTVPDMGTRTLIPRAALDDLVSGRASTTGGRTTALPVADGLPESEAPIGRR